MSLACKQCGLDLCRNCQNRHLQDLLAADDVRSVASPQVQAAVNVSHSSWLHAAAHDRFAFQTESAYLSFRARDEAARNIASSSWSHAAPLDKAQFIGFDSWATFMEEHHGWSSIATPWHFYYKNGLEGARTDASSFSSYDAGIDQMSSPVAQVTSAENVSSAPDSQTTGCD